MSGSGHKIFRVKQKPAANVPGSEAKLETIEFDPWGILAPFFSLKT